MENSEPWINSSIVSKLLINNVIHGGNIYDDEYWDERDALRFIKKIPSNIIFKESELNNYSFHTGMIHPVVMEYIKEMFFVKPWIEQ